MNTKIIGLIGGMGPYAGLDVYKKLLQNTTAVQDEDHLNVVLVSLCKEVPPRNEFLLGKSTINPATTLVKKIEQYQFDLIGIACNTFHAPPIFDKFTQLIKDKHPTTKILHLPNEVKNAVIDNYAGKTIGVLSTVGTYHLNIYQDAFKDTSIHLKFPDEQGKQAIQDAITAIKINGTISKQSKLLIEQALADLTNVDAILLACTELPLVVDQINFEHPVIDPNLILAQTLIHEVNPASLKQ